MAFAGYRRLALGVIAAAVVDAGKGQDEARRFLRGGADLEFWCRVADVSLDAVTSMAAKRWGQA
jgi:hypothetical protein